MSDEATATECVTDCCSSYASHLPISLHESMSVSHCLMWKDVTYRSSWFRLSSTLFGTSEELRSQFET